MRQYLVSGFFKYQGGVAGPMIGYVFLEDDRVMDQAALERAQRTLVEDNNRGDNAIAVDAQIAAFQPLEVKAPEVVIDVKMDASKALTDIESLVQRLQGLKATGEQLNLPEVLPPVGCPIMISLSDVLVPVERIGHLRSREDEITYRLTDGKIIAGRFSWTYP